MKKTLVVGAEHVAAYIVKHAVANNQLAHFFFLYIND